MGLEILSDDELLLHLQAASRDVVVYGPDEPDKCQEAWRQLIAGISELETRYPPEPPFTG